MTNEQAAIKLQNILNDDHYAWTPAHAEALEMAVEALKTCNQICNNGDLISRQKGHEHDSNLHAKQASNMEFR